jgi:hypothetical protein
VKRWTPKWDHFRRTSLLGDGARGEDVFEVGEAKKEAGSIRTSLFFSLYV